MSSKIIAIVGSTGNQGGSVLKTLVNAGNYKIRALSRNPNSDTATKLKSKYPAVDWIKADLDDIDSLRKAFAGAYAVFGVTQPDDPSVVKKIEAGNLEAEFEQGKNIIDAAIAEGVKVAVMSTLESFAEKSKGKYTKCLNIENKHMIAQYLDSKADQIKGANVYMGFYLEEFVTYARISAEDGETVEFPTPLNPTTKVAFVDTVNDTGPVVMYALEHADKLQGKPLVVSGGIHEVQDAVKAFAEVTGKPARYVQFPHEVAGVEEHIQTLKVFDEFGHFSDYDFVNQNKNIDYQFVTLTEFWKNRGWTGPST